MKRYQSFQLPALETLIQPAMHQPHDDGRWKCLKRKNENVFHDSPPKKYGNYILRRTFTKYKGVFDHKEGEKMKTCFLSIWRVVDPIYFFFKADLG